MRKTVFRFFTWALAVVLAVGLQTAGVRAEVRYKVLALPLDIRGDYRPISNRELLDAVKSLVARMAPEAEVIEVREADLKGIDPHQPPTLEQAQKLAALYGATDAVWVSSRFRRDFTKGVLVISSSSRVWMANCTGKIVLVDEPLGLVGVSSPNSSKAVLEEESMLSSKCAFDLAQALVQIGQRDEAEAMIKKWPESGSLPRLSPHIKAFTLQTGKYLHALEVRELFSAVDAQRLALEAWQKMSKDEKTQAEAALPGSRKWMEGGWGRGFRYYYPRYYHQPPFPPHP